MTVVKNNKKKITWRKSRKEEILQKKYKKIRFPIKITKTTIN